MRSTKKRYVYVHKMVVIATFVVLQILTKVFVVWMEIDQWRRI